MSVEPLSYADAKQEDFEQLLQLLREYTDKLQDVTNRLILEQRRRNQITFSLGGMALLAYACSTLFLGSLAGASILAFRLLAVFALAVASVYRVLTLGQYGSSFFPSLGRGSSSDFRRESLARALSRLIKMSSQYFEHAGSRIGNRFEFELRLADAESALRMYERTTSNAGDFKIRV